MKIHWTAMDGTKPISLQTTFSPYLLPRRILITFVGHYKTVRNCVASGDASSINGPAGPLLHAPIFSPYAPLLWAQILMVGLIHRCSAPKMKLVKKFLSKLM